MPFGAKQLQQLHWHKQLPCVTRLGPRHEHLKAGQNKVAKSLICLGKLVLTSINSHIYQFLGEF